tara:strand:- start:272 stop:1816 length:1545 start_codon:yes stop_codon:yes gene_type:complete
MDVPFIGGFFTNSRGQQYGPLVRKKKLKSAGNSIVSRTPYDTSTKSGARNVTGGIRQKTDDYLSSIEKRANMPRSASRPKRVPGGKRPRVKPTMRRSTKKRKLKRTVKRPSKKRKVSATKYHVHRYEQEGTCNSTQPFMYVGVNDCYSRDSIWDAIADSLLRPILAKEFKFYPLQDTDKIGNMYQYSASVPCALVFDFKRVTAPGSGTSGEEHLIQPLVTGTGNANALPDCYMLLDDATYDTMRQRMSYILRHWADADNVGSNVGNGTAPLADTVAFFPYQYHVVSGADGAWSTDQPQLATRVVRTGAHLGDTMIDLQFSQKLVFVNRTLAEGGGVEGQNIDRLGTNPLKGKVYQFNDASPRILDHVDMSPAFKTLIQSSPTTGQFGMDRYQTLYHGPGGLDNHLAHPLAAKYWLKNCAKETNFFMKPGGSLTHNTTKSIKGKLSTLIERFYYSGFDKGTFGQCTLLMFDMVNHTATSQLPTTTYKRSCFVKSAGKLRAPKLYVPDFEAFVQNV